jgi:hypothetical protein
MENIDELDDKVRQCQQGLERYLDIADIVVCEGPAMTIAQMRYRLKGWGYIFIAATPVYMNNTLERYKAPGDL